MVVYRGPGPMVLVGSRVVLVKKKGTKGRTRKN